MRETLEKTDCVLSLWEAMITNLVFTRDVVIIAETLEVLVGALDTLSTKFEPLDLKVSWIQRFVAFFDENIDLPPPAAVQGEFFLLC